MKIIIAGLSALLSSVLFGSICCEKPKIAILGAGIGGSSCAYFIKELLGDAVQIDVYEAKQIGGRLATIDYGSSTYEAGGAIIHERNKYMNGFRDLFHLEERPDKMKQIFGIYDDGRFEFISSNYDYWTLCKMIWRYGFWSLMRLRSFIENMLDQFDRIYDLQEDEQSFVTVNELMAEASSQFTPYFKTSSKDGFSTIAKVNDDIINDLVRGSLRVNYGQSVDVHLFVGSVSVAGMFGSLWSVKGGNKLVPEKLLQHSSANILYRRVTKVMRDPNNKKFHIESAPENHLESISLQTNYDIVVIANPITGDRRTSIEFLNFTKPIEVSGVYHRTVATFISGTVNGSYFGRPVNDTPKLIINNDEKHFINSMGTLETVNEESEGTDANEDVWKIFSQRPLTDRELEALFQKRGKAKSVDWLAYPHYDKLNLDGKFVLDDKVFYVNAIEWAASAMEMSAIGAKNVALLVQKELKDVVGVRSKNKKKQKREINESKSSWFHSLYCKYVHPFPFGKNVIIQC